MNLLNKLLSPDDEAYFTEFTSAVSDACHHSNSTQKIKDENPNKLDFDPVKPGGLKSYPAIWTQDFTMVYAAGFISYENGFKHLLQILKVQNGKDSIQMNTGAAVPPWAIPDHVNFDGSPVFFPGTYSSGLDQGGSYGLRPPYNNYYDIIWLAWMLLKDSEDLAAQLNRDINGITLYERLSKAFNVPTVDDKGIVYTTAEERAVGFIFCDTVEMTGDLLMATLLRMRAAGHMRDFANAIGYVEEAKNFDIESEKAKDHISTTFKHESGWLKACTGISSQPDVFGTLYALYTDKLEGADKEAAMSAIIEGLAHNKIEQEGALRHVPLNFNYSAETTWEKANAKNNTYQNGGYWFMPAGWLVAVLYKDHPVEAKHFLNRYILSMKKEDFRKGEEGLYAPWEWIFEGERSENIPLFGPSATLPYAVLREYLVGSS